VIGPYGVNQEGSGDMYAKGANLLHTIRQVINNDEKFRGILRGLNKDFYHQTVTTQQVEQYISQKSGRDFSKVFDQYLRTVKIPTLEIKGDAYRWTGCVEGFNMPVRLTNGQLLTPTTDWKKTEQAKAAGKVEVDANFYINVKYL
jgi:aminopeptidase N